MCEVGIAGAGAWLGFSNRAGAPEGVTWVLMVRGAGEFVAKTIADWPAPGLEDTHLGQPAPAACD